MRTTLDLDETLVQAALRLYPPGTPKTVVFEEALRTLLARAPRGEARRLGFFAADGPVRLHDDWNDPLPEFDELP